MTEKEPNKRYRSTGANVFVSRFSEAEKHKELKRMEHNEKMTGKASKSTRDTFASKVAAIHDKHADASVGNVTGSNAVNVFLGIGVAWSIAAMYHAFVEGDKFKVDPGNLAFSVTIFCTEAAIAILILLLRRSKAVGGELGGPTGLKYLTSSVLFGLWITYLVVSTLEAYGVIRGF